MEDASASTTYQARGGSVRLGARTTTAPTPTGAEQNQARNGLEGAAHRFAPLWPLILGLAFGRAGLIVASYGSYTSTDEGIFTDGAMLVALVVLALFLVFIVLSKRTISKHVTNVIMRTCVALEAFVLMALAVFDLFGIGDEIERFALSSLCTLVSSGAIYYWLRRARGTSTTTAAVFVFAALIISEVEIYLCTLLPVFAGNFVAAALVLLQYPCIIWARRQRQPHDIVSPTQANDYFGFSKTMLQSKQFLTATALGIGCLSIVIGLLRGYPDGTSIAFTPATRIAYAALTIGVSVALIVLVLKWRERVMTVGIFVIMELLACFALIAYAGFPDMLDIGAVFTTTLNALMVGFTWYVIIAFMSYGWRDPYYYASRMAGVARLPRRSAYRVAGGSRAVLQRHAHERRDGHHGGPLHAIGVRAIPQYHASQRRGTRGAERTTTEHAQDHGTRRTRKPCGHATGLHEAQRRRDGQAVPVVRSGDRGDGAVCARLHAEARGRRAVHHAGHGACPHQANLR